MPSNFEKAHSCEDCGEQFITANRRYYYSKKALCPKCASASNKNRNLQNKSGSYVTCSLPGCNKEVYRMRHKLREGKKYFCCRDHQNKTVLVLDDYKTGPKSTNPANTGSYRTRALRLYGSTCEICGFSENELLLDVHHIDANRRNNAPTNLIVLCIMCHAQLSRGLATLENRKLSLAKDALQRDKYARKRLDRSIRIRQAQNFG